mgnify:CR=1 FL=1
MYNENIDLDDEDVSNSGGFDFKNFYYNNKKLVWLLLGIVIFIIFVSLITSCDRNTSEGDNNQNNQQDLEPTLTLSSRSESLSIGSSKQITATVTNYPNAIIMYSSSNDSIASVSSSGLVTGKGMGTASIYAVYVHNGNKVYRDECLVTVSMGNNSVKVSSVSFPDGDLVIGVGKTFNLADKLIIDPSDAYIYQKYFNSNDSNIARVEATGQVKAVSVGTTYISVSVNNVFDSKIKVIVVNSSLTPEIIKGPESINISQGLIKLKLSETKKIDFTTSPSGVGLNSLTWTSSNSSVAKVDSNGNVTGIKEGSSTITVTSFNGVSSKTVVEVSKSGDDVVVDTVTYTETSITMKAGSTYTITPVVVPYNAINKTLTFSSSNPSVASVTSNGVSAVVTAYNTGTSTITFASSNGKQGSVLINVTSDNYNNDYNYNYNENSNYNYGGSSSNSSGSGSSSSGNSSGSSNTSSTSIYAKITTSKSSIVLLPNSYTTFTIKTNVSGTIKLNTSSSDISYPSGQATTFNISANEEKQVRVQATKSTSSTAKEYIMIDFIPSDTSIRETTKNISVTIN